MKITRIVDGAAVEYNVCDECAATVSPHHAKINKKKKVDTLSVENLLKDLLSQQEAIGVKMGLEGDAPAELPVCPSCGLEFLRYKQTFMLGCPDCYDAFGEYLLADLKKIHGATEHMGGRLAVSRSLIDLQARLRTLRHELDECVQSENFDRAAQLRDQIRRIQSEHETQPKGQATS